jgi:hypothetical protein
MSGNEPLWDNIEPGEWEVFRLDDNGNTYLVRDKLSEIFARQAAQVLTGRGHKQTYWCDKHDKNTPHVRPGLNS